MSPYNVHPWSIVGGWGRRPLGKHGPTKNIAASAGKALDRVDPKPGSLARFHFMMMIVWGLLAIPTVLIWKESILRVAFMSLYANFVGHFSGWDGARAEKIAAE